MKTDTKQKWLETGYALFGEYGPDRLNIKLLSEKAALPRSNFYYYFADKEDLIEQLLALHRKLSENFNVVLKEQMEVFLPDLHKIAEPYLNGFKFHRQLFLQRTDPRFNWVYVSINRAGNPVILPKLISYYKLNVPYEVIESLWMTVIDTWYSRLDVNRFEAPYLCELTEDIMKTVLDFARIKLFVDEKK